MRRAMAYDCARIRRILLLIVLLQSKGAIGWLISKHGLNGWKCELRSSSTCSSSSLSHTVSAAKSRLWSSSLSTSRETSRDDEQSTSLINAFAGLTQSSCKLLGVKSIGVDYGLVRTGVAKTAGYQPQAVEILADLNETQVADRVVRLAKLEGAGKIILGLPLHKNGTIAEQTNLTLAFGQVLARASLRTLGPEVYVELWDERYTSKEAAARAHARNPHQTLYGMLDAEAACIILEQYYNDNGRDAQIIEIQDEAMRDACLDAFEKQQEWERMQKQHHFDERERLMQRRKEAIRRDQQAAADSAGTPGGKKKKKKKKRR